MTDSTSAERATTAAYDAWHQGHDVDVDASTPWHQLVRAALEPGRDLRGRRVLEIGCGRGGFACWLAGQPAAPAQVVAADFSPVAVEKARAFGDAHGFSTITWKVGDIEAIGEADASFDTVVSCETIEHVPHPARALRELARVLKSGGRLFLTTPNYLGVMGAYRGWLRLTGRRFSEGGQPICNFTMLPRTVAWVKAAGLRVERVDAVGHYVLWPGRPQRRVPALDHLGWLTRWNGLHSFVLATRP